MKISIRDLMTQSGVAFGTSGARGLVTAMTDRVCYAYTRGFLQYLETIGELKRAGEAVAVAGDLRPSTGRIMEAVCRAAEASGYHAVNCGRIPSPAVALYGFTRHIPSIMVTGSHIPDDRNGIKFNKCTGEVLKTDEAGMAAQMVEIEDAKINAAGESTSPATTPRPVSADAGQAYVWRYLESFATDTLAGFRIGVYQHSAVGRDSLVEILQGLGAETVTLGRADTFIPVDTEAIRAEDIALARQWATAERLDAIVSTDGDSDRPLISDEHGRWLRGDVAGILCARFLGADSVSTPVSCNTAVERCGWFREIRRTRIGSPYVVAAMQEATARGGRCVVGYEANGGFLLNTPVQIGERKLGALPTRDAVIVIIGILALARARKQTISALLAALPARFTASDRLQNFPTEQSRAILARFTEGGAAAQRTAIEKVFGELCGTVSQTDHTDGLRIIFAGGDIIHLRPSGNAPEFRCYTEAASEERAQSLNQAALACLRKLEG